jgi:hypothetical protein
MIYFHIMVMVIALLICYKWGDWRHWNNYYPTIQFFIIGDLIYCILFRNSILWMYVTDILNHTLVNMLMMFIVYPSIVLVFIPYYPKSISKKIGYIFLWVVLVTGIEHISHSLGYFSYHNGWNLGWSVIFTIVMFPLLYLHYNKPLLAWFAAFIELVVYIVLFKVDIINLI